MGRELKPNKTLIQIPHRPQSETAKRKNLGGIRTMNPLTLVKRIQNINSREAQLGISEEASWHAKYKDSAYVYVGGIPFDLTEGDLLAVFAQYGEIVDVNLVRDKATGKSKGFAFVAYEDQRSTILAVDNLNGAQILGRTIRVDHVTKYKKKEEEDEEEAQRKREERAFAGLSRKANVHAGDSCKFSHNEQRAANTGWGEKDPKWGRDSYEGPKRGEKRSSTIPPNRVPEPKGQEEFRSGDRELDSRRKGNGRDFESHPKRGDGREQKRLGRQGGDDEKFEPRSRDHDRGEENRSRRWSEDAELGPNSRENYGRREEQRSRRHNDDEFQPKSREDYDRKEDKRPEGLKSGEDHDRRGDDRRENKRLRRHSDDGEIEPKSKDDRGRRENDSREDKGLRRHAGDADFDPKSRDNHDRMDEKRLRRHIDYENRRNQKSRRRNDNEFDLRSRAGKDKREGERLRRDGDDEIQPKSREGRHRSEKGE
ncbi:zinc finger CCCH domain-containing protein 25-like [Pyrus ussuriensis x Pyrus communis]|uniref:Zinc finger CCCH domain-containing protein 25-like n=1 Tax=Pyrus ussuriensis x Pyrus communis TaxID=2448454 RepID=A0A5N5GLV3_9ROSA|nr:zinc finger CCCH domain-containing protein 25-like [Pyrus ussuriensis x Pyrus communis]